MLFAAVFVAALAVESQATPPNVSTNFESAVETIAPHVKDMIKESAKALQAELAKRLKRLTAGTQGSRASLERLRSEIVLLKGRLAPAPNRPADPLLDYEIRRMTEDFQQLDNTVGLSLATARDIGASIQGKDPGLAGPAAAFQKASEGLKNDVLWFGPEIMFLGWDLRAAGFPFAAVNIEAASRSIDLRVQNLSKEAQDIIEKTR